MSLEAQAIHDLLGRAEALRNAAKRSTQERHVFSASGSGETKLAALVQSTEGRDLVAHLVDGLNAFLEHGNKRLSDIQKEVRRHAS